MFNKELRRRLEGEEEREIRSVLLRGQYEALHRVMEEHGWDESQGLSYIVAAGIRAIHGWTEAGKPLDQMTLEERLRFLQDRAAQAEAAYSMLKFQAYQVMNQNDALEMNMKGLIPQLKAARERVEELQAEVEELRPRVPQHAHSEPVPSSSQPAEKQQPRFSVGDRLRRLFNRG